MTGASSLLPENLDGMTIAEMIAMLEYFGYSTEALSNEEVLELATSCIDGHDDEGGEIEDLDFSMDFKQEAYHGD